MRTTRTSHLASWCGALAAGLLGLGCSMGVTTDDESRGTSQPIIHGQLDGADHPNVGLMLNIVQLVNGATGDFEGYWFWTQCSGTVIGDDRFLTAAHCTTASAFDVVGPDGGPPDGIPDIGYPFVSALYFSGTEGELVTKNNPPFPFPYNWDYLGEPFAHPEYANFAGYPNTHDVGLVMLTAFSSYVSEVGRGTPSPLSFDEAPAPVAPPGLVPTTNAPNNFVITVGYGLQRADPNGKDEGLRAVMDISKARTDVMALDRYEATQKFIVNGGKIAGGEYNLETVAGPRQVPDGYPLAGGSCFGDSGGPNFVRDASGVEHVAAVTSFGNNSVCAGVGGNYRVDAPDIYDWVLNGP